MSASGGRSAKSPTRLTRERNPFCGRGRVTRNRGRQRKIKQPKGREYHTLTPSYIVSRVSGLNKRWGGSLTFSLFHRRRLLSFLGRNARRSARTPARASASSWGTAAIRGSSRGLSAKTTDGRARRLSRHFSGRILVGRLHSLGWMGPRSAFRRRLQPKSSVLCDEKGSKITVPERCFSPGTGFFSQVLLNKPAIDHGNADGIRSGQVEDDGQMRQAGRKAAKGGKRAEHFGRKEEPQLVEDPSLGRHSLGD